MNEPWSFFEISSLIGGGIVLILLIHYGPTLAVLARGFWRDWRTPDDEGGE